MPKKSNQKLKLVYLYQLLLQKTDENHRMTADELLAALSRYGIEDDNIQLDTLGGLAWQAKKAKVKIFLIKFLFLAETNHLHPYLVEE